MPHHDPDELFDVVDEADRVIGLATRAVVHRDGLRHRSSHVFLLNSHGELFLQRRALTKDEDPGAWDSSAAGHLDAGESYVAGAVRELREELGVTVEPTRLVEVARLPATAEAGWEFRRLFVLSTDEPLSPDPTEVMEGRFLAAVEIERRLADGSLPVTRAFAAFYSLYRAWSQGGVLRTPP
ncbi:MAG TPA: NUDIX domain-containing protein [Candidatus Methylomirabilis sp.]|nr:NUDIX domain-containing protein [Candidatus Methylomirabilis sp.]